MGNFTKIKITLCDLEWNTMAQIKNKKIKKQKYYFLVKQLFLDCSDMQSIQYIN